MIRICSSARDTSVISSHVCIISSSASPSVAAAHSASQSACSASCSCCCSSPHAAYSLVCAAASILVFSSETWRSRSAGVGRSLRSSSRVSARAVSSPHAAKSPAATHVSSSSLRARICVSNSTREIGGTTANRSARALSRHRMVSSSSAQR